MTVAALNAVDAQAVADQHEDALTDAYYKVLAAAGRKAAQRFRKYAPLTITAASDQVSGKQPDWTSPNIDELVDLGLIARDTRKQTRDIHQDALGDVMSAYGESLAGVDLGISFDITNPASISMLDKLNPRAGDVAKSIRDDLVKVISEAYTQGFSVARTADEIVARSDQFSVAQARMLARTDLNSVASSGSFAAAQEVGVGYKVWIATEDEVTRESHQEADGQVVPLDQPFDVGGEDLMFPGDPEGSDAETCNCRCALGFQDTADGAGEVAAGWRGSSPGATIANGGAMSEAQITIPLHLNIGVAGSGPGYGGGGAGGGATISLGRGGGGGGGPQPSYGRVVVKSETLTAAAPDPQLAAALNEALGATWAFYVKAHGFHWNVVGDDFPELHDFFGDLYQEVWDAVDVIAEAVRTLQVDAPGSPQQLEQLSNIPSAMGAPPAPQMVRELLADNDAVIAKLKNALMFTQANPGIENMLQGRVEMHEKHGWQLRATATPEALLAAASGSTDLPLSDRDTPWDAGAAQKTLEPADFPKAHFWKNPDGPADQITSYKFPFARREGGKLVAVWKGVTAAAQRLSTAKGVDEAAIRRKMAPYYKAAAVRFKDPSIKTPWARMAHHDYMDDGSGQCLVCGAGPDAQVHSMVAASPGPTWRAVLCVEGEPTEDGRLLAPGSITWRELPLSLLCQMETAAGHDGAEVCGRIDRIYRDGNQIIGEGIFDSSTFGLETSRLVTEQTLRGISVDLAVLEYEMQPKPDADDQQMMEVDGGIYEPDDPDELYVVTDGVIGAATICAFQAIAQATIEVLTSAGTMGLIRITSPLTPQEALTAAAPVFPPADWFDDPKLDKPTMLTVTPEGRVFGHVAPWRGCHTGYVGRCVPPPRSKSGYAHFHVGRIQTDDGSLLPVGRLTLASGHADTVGMTSERARAHYDNTSTVAAYVRAGEDKHGIWVSGALKPDTPPSMMQELLANPLSGDWRNGEMIAAHAVPVPGFPILQASAIGPDGEEETALIITSTVGILTEGEPVDLAVRTKVLAASARGIEGLAELARS